MTTVTYTVHDRAGIKGNDRTIMVRSDGGPDERAVCEALHRQTAGFTAPLPCHVALYGGTEGIGMKDELLAAFAEHAQACAQFRRCAEDYYHRSNGDYSLIDLINTLSNMGQRLEYAYLDRVAQERGAK